MKRPCTESEFKHIFDDILTGVFNGAFTSVNDIEQWYNISLSDEQIDTINSNIESIYTDDERTVF